MNKIGAEEKRIDPKTESSFYPSMYKPRIQNTDPQESSGNNDTGNNAPDSESAIPVPTSTNGLPYSSLFLPCHYFQYAGGTSTGG
jgi:hypothetical protein